MQSTDPCTAIFEQPFSSGNGHARRGGRLSRQGRYLQEDTEALLEHLTGAYCTNVVLFTTLDARIVPQANDQHSSVQLVLVHV